MNKRERTIGIVAGAVIGLLALDSLIVSPLMERQASADSRVELAQEKLKKANDVFQNDLRAKKRWKEMAADTLKTDQSAAESALLNQAREWASEARLSLTALSPQRNEKEKGFQKITIRAIGTGSMQQVARFLYLAETAKIPVRVSDIQISARKEGTDDLQLNVGFATLYLPPETPKSGTTEAGR